MILPGGVQLNPGPVTTPSATQGMSPELQQRAQMLAQWLQSQGGANRGMNPRDGGMPGMGPQSNTGIVPPNMQQQGGLPSGGMMGMIPPGARGVGGMGQDQMGEQDIVPQGAMGQMGGQPVYGANGQPIAGRQQPQPTIGQFGAAPVKPVGPVTTQGPSRGGMPVLPPGLMNRLQVFR